MSDPENFIARWSRRKRDAVEQAEEIASPAAADTAVESAHATEDEHKPRDAAAARDTVPAPAELPFDPVSLPSIESITAESDIRGFLAPGVPPELTRAALRRAWSVDPKIRDYIGLSENSWDFNAPGSMAGFGPLEMTDELRRLVARMVGGDVDEDRAERPNPAAAAASDSQTSNESIETVARTTGRPTEDDNAHLGTAQDEPVANNGEASSHNELAQRDKEHIALQQKLEEPDDLQAIVKRPHGRALPK